MRQRGRCITLMLLLAALYAASSIATCSVTAEPLTPPTLTHPLGTDPLGRDALCVMIAGLAPTLTAALAAATTVTLAAIAAAATPAPRLARIASRTALILPRIALLALLAQLATLDATIIGLLVGLLYAPEVTAPLSLEAEKTWRSPLVEAAKAIGATRARIAARYVIPWLAPRIASYAALAASTAIVATAGLSMIGVLPATQLTIGTLAYLVMTTPGAIYTLAGQVQLAAFAAVTILAAYATHRTGTCITSLQGHSED